MFLTEVSHIPGFSAFRGNKRPSLPTRLDLVSSAFDETLRRPLNALNPPSLTITWFSSALEFISFAHTEARTLILNLELSDSDCSQAWYLNDSIKILDLCNMISTEIESLKQRRLMLNFAIHLLSEENRSLPGKLEKARQNLFSWEDGLPFGLNKKSSAGNLEDLVREIVTGLDKAPRRKISKVDKLARRTIRSVGLITVSIASALLSALRRSPEVLPGKMSTAEFLWGDSFNSLMSAVTSELTRRGLRGDTKGGLFDEVDEIRTSIKQVNDVIADGTNEKVNNAIRELKKVAESFSHSLERLSDGVNELFRTVLGNRKAILENLRVGGQEKEPRNGPKKL